MEPYSPKRILSEHEEAELGGDFLAYLIHTAENKDPVTPFSSIKTIDDNRRIHVNCTNDLKWTIDDGIDWINNNECDYVIIGDRADGYSSENTESLERLFQSYAPVEITRDKEWIIVKINTKDRRVIISNQTIKIE